MKFNTGLQFLVQTPGDLAPKFYTILSSLWRFDLPCWAG
jgi:hypothetical protein